MLGEKDISSRQLFYNMDRYMDCLRADKKIIKGERLRVAEMVTVAIKMIVNDMLSSEPNDKTSVARKDAQGEGDHTIKIKP